MIRNLTGVQACIEGIITLRKIDALLELKTGVVISGYRGSPLAGFDKECWKRKKEFEIHKIHFINGLNEELALAAIAGSQQYHYFGKAKEEYEDGVTGFWYGKGPGVDRSMDAIHHYAYQGTTKYGGVVLFCGNDTIMSSSTMPHDTSPTLATLHIPVLTPSDIKDIIDFTVKGTFLSRYSGSYVALSIVTEIADAYQSVNENEIFGSLLQKFCHWKELLKNHDNGGYRWPDDGESQEKRIYEKRLKLIDEFVAKYGFDTIYSNNNDRGIVCVGKCFENLKSAVEKFDKFDILKVGCAWPLNEKIVLEFVKNKKELLVIEEKDAFVENQLKRILYDNGIHVKINGKNLISPLKGVTSEDVKKALIETSFIEKESENSITKNHSDSSFNRIPYFCGGCPHNTGTKLPEGELSVLGIGCHYLASKMPDRPAITVCPMGAEGVSWIAISKFTEKDHLFVNLGDGTYFHSGILAIRFAVATKTKMTFKILYNGAVAMTGGQPVDGNLTLESLVKQIMAEGVEKIVVVSHDYAKALEELSRLPVKVFPKNKILDVQIKLKNYNGVSVLIYDQPCATEKRRKEKRNLAKKSNYEVVIHDAICDACGDCQKKSNCMAIGIDHDNPYLPKRYVNDDFCNDDRSCIEGFCPSFALIKRQENRKIESFPFAKTNSIQIQQPEEWTIAIHGIGGTGTSTATKILSDALLKNGYHISSLDKTGLAQRFGPINGIVSATRKLRRIKPEVDLILVIDPVSLMNHEGFSTENLVVNSNIFNLPNIIHDDNLSIFSKIREKILTIPTRFSADFSYLTKKYIGSELFTNIVMIGFAWQKGLIPCSYEQMMETIKEVFGNFAEKNLLAFELGRSIAENLVDQKAQKQNLDEMFINILNKYDPSHKTTETYVHYKNLIEQHSLNENLKKRIKRAIFDLLYRKDEYEVARLWYDYIKQNDIQGKIYVSIFGTRKQALPVFIAKPLFFLLKNLHFSRYSFCDIHHIRKENRIDAKYRNNMLKKFEECLCSNCNEEKKLLEMVNVVEKVRGYGHVRLKNINKYAKQYL